jgi:hypothetical protein
MLDEYVAAAAPRWRDETLDLALTSVTVPTRQFDSDTTQRMCRELWPLAEHSASVT